MNKLINRISPETSENRILHAGFSIILMSEEITQTLSGLSSDMIIFILSGSITTIRKTTRPPFQNEAFLF